MWLDTQFQNAVEGITVEAAERGIESYEALMRLPDKPAWRNLTDTVVAEELTQDLPLEELEIASDEEGFERYDPDRFLPVSLAKVEAVDSMRFEPDVEIGAPSDLYEHTNDGTKTRLLPAYSHLFEHSATSSFFTYIPVYF
ncbi:hypothetical protein V7S43_007518 [Phytophthora oleae]|uniref:Uncharacterized protein n=1 Tax=Phytophthora oleae TaxID=2107226 RepID=A0ABD3FNG6_9STRA